MIRPVLDYSSAIYHESPKIDLIKIDRVQYAALRITLVAFKSTHVPSLEVESNIMNITNRQNLFEIHFLQQKQFRRVNIKLDASI